MKRTLVALLLVMSVLGATPVQASIGGGMVNVGVRESVRHAGVDNWSVQVYYTPDGQPPGRGAKPFAFSLSSSLEHALPGVPYNYNTGQLLPGKFWALVKFRVINAGEIKEQKGSVEAMAVPYSDALGGYLIDLSDPSLLGERNWVGVAVTHMGGEVTYQLVIFLVRKKRQVTDEAGFWLANYDPTRPVYQAEEQALAAMRGLDAANGSFTFSEAMGEAELPVFPVAHQPAQPGEGRVVVTLWRDKARLEAVTDQVKVQLQTPDGQPATQVLTTSTGSAELFVLAGSYRLAVEGGGIEWTTFDPNQLAGVTVSDAATTEIVVVPRQVMATYREVRASGSGGGAVRKED